MHFSRKRASLDVRDEREHVKESQHGGEAEGERESA